LRDKSNANIYITGSNNDDISRAKEMINRAVYSNDQDRNQSDFNVKRPCYQNSDYNRSSFETSKPASNNNNNHNDNEPKKSIIDWDLIRAQPLQNLNKFKDHPPVVKDFYKEDPEITAMSREEVKQYRLQNFNIMVELFVKEVLTYTLEAAKPKEPEKTPEQIEDYIFENIPKPVKTIKQAFKHYPEILQECERQKFVKPSPVQSQMWPILLKGIDCVGM
jgi:ATP-dependent RNA helicase DDX43